MLGLSLDHQTALIFDPSGLSSPIAVDIPGAPMAMYIHSESRKAFFALADENAIGVLDIGKPLGSSTHRKSERLVFETITRLASRSPIAAAFVILEIRRQSRRVWIARPLIVVEALRLRLVADAECAAESPSLRKPAQCFTLFFQARDCSFSRARFGDSPAS